MFKKLLVSLALLMLCSNSYAALITHGNYTLNDATDVVTDGTTEWLQWDVTSGQSINQALATYSSDGWVLASNSQMANLYNTFGFGAPVFNDSEDGGQQKNAAASQLYRQFVELFGAVSFLIDQCATANQPQCLDNPADAATSALFGSDTDGDDNYKAAIVTIAGQGQVFGPIGNVIGTGNFQPNSARLTDDIYSRDSSPTLTLGGIFGAGPSGVALVRTQPVIINDIPEPATLAILGLGLMGLSSRKFKK